LLVLLLKGLCFYKSFFLKKPKRIIEEKPDRNCHICKDDILNSIPKSEGVYLFLKNIFCCISLQTCWQSDTHTSAAKYKVRKFPFGYFKKHHFTVHSSLCDIIGIGKAYNKKQGGWQNSIRLKWGLRSRSCKDLHQCDRAGAVTWCGSDPGGSGSEPTSNTQRFHFFNVFMAGVVYCIGLKFNI
jgi:hypothetical protein